MNIRTLMMSCLAATVLLFVSTLQAEEESPDRRFYVAPFVSYDFLDPDYGFDDSYGYRLAIGKPLSDSFNLELTGYEIESSASGIGDVQLQGVGLNLLWFPQRYQTPFFGILGVADGDIEIGSFEESATIGEVGAGFIHPLFESGFASLRAEYRYRNVFLSDISDAKDHVVLLGLEIPLGSRQSPQRVSPSDWTSPPAPPPLPVAIIESGCPDDDNDGVCNDVDECPNTAAGATVLDNGCALDADRPLVLKGVEFEFDRAVLLPVSRNILDQAVTVLNGSPSLKVEVGGHTDARGSDAYNQSLSERRAKAVREYLVNAGIDPMRLQARGYGESQPIAPNQNSDGSDNPDGRARNRRVELKVINK